MSGNQVPCPWWVWALYGLTVAAALALSELNNLGIIHL
jgi:hypothetical protein